MANSLSLFVGFLSLYCVHYAACITIPPFPGKPLSSAGLGQQLGSIAPFPNGLNNLTLQPILESVNYLSLLSLSRGKVYRFDTNTTHDYCNINLQAPLGVWIWATPCAEIPVGDTCYAALSSEGDLQVLDGSTVVLWSSGTAGKGVKYIDLQDSGELVLLDASNVTVWKSSDHIFRSGLFFCNTSASASSPASAPTKPPIFPIPKPLSSAGLGQKLGSIAPFTNSLNNVTLYPILESTNYLSLASLSRAQVHRYDTNTTYDYCNINLQAPLGVWTWATPCGQIPIGHTCYAALSSDGQLQVLDGSAVVLWTSGTAGKGVKYIELQNSGELVLLDASNATVWKSSDHVFESHFDFCNVSTSASSPAPAPAPALSGSGVPPSSGATPSTPSSGSSPGLESGGPGEGPAPGRALQSSSIALFVPATLTLLSGAAAYAALYVY